jgi:hypothetical protein
MSPFVIPPWLMLSSKVSSNGNKVESNFDF